MKYRLNGRCAGDGLPEAAVAGLDHAVGLAKHADAGFHRAAIQLHALAGVAPVEQIAPCRHVYLALVGVLVGQPACRKTGGIAIASALCRVNRAGLAGNHAFQQMHAWRGNRQRRVGGAHQGAALQGQVGHIATGHVQSHAAVVQPFAVEKMAIAYAAAGGGDHHAMRRSGVECATATVVEGAVHGAQTIAAQPGQAVPAVVFAAHLAQRHRGARCGTGAGVVAQAHAITAMVMQVQLRQHQFGVGTGVDPIGGQRSATFAPFAAQGQIGRIAIQRQAMHGDRCAVIAHHNDPAHAGSVVRIIERQAGRGMCRAGDRVEAAQLQARCQAQGGTFALNQHGCAAAADGDHILALIGVTQAGLPGKQLLAYQVNARGNLQDATASRAQIGACLNKFVGDIDIAIIDGIKINGFRNRCSHGILI